MSHHEEPHTHTLQWENNNGQIFRHTHNCPLQDGDADNLTAVIQEAGTVNNLLADGTPQTFETVISLLFSLGLEPRHIGQEYITSENLNLLLTSIAQPTPGSTE